MTETPDITTPQKTPSQEMQERADRMYAAAEEAGRTRQKHFEAHKDALQAIEKWPEMRYSLEQLVDEAKAASNRFADLHSYFSETAQSLYAQAAQLGKEERMKAAVQLRDAVELKAAAQKRDQEAAAKLQAAQAADKLKLKAEDKPKAADATTTDEEPPLCVTAETMRGIARQIEKEAEAAAQARDKNLEMAKAAKLDMEDTTQNHAAAYYRWREATKTAVDFDRLREGLLFTAAKTYLEASAFEGQTLARAAAAATVKTT